MRDGRAEQVREGFVAGFVEVLLAAEEDDLVGEERGADVGDGGGVEVAAEADAVDAGADAPADPGHGDGGGGGGHGGSLNVRAGLHRRGEGAGGWQRW